LREQAGVNLESAIDILNTSWGKSMMMERNGPITVEKEFENSPAPLRNLVKDLGIIKELTDQLGLELPVTKASSSVVDTTMSLGLNEPDIAATALSIKKLSNID
jgi:3-hydroxyisobutyrate dehydrogenase and related beta-hydroxyacid dehydrogenases